MNGLVLRWETGDDDNLASFLLRDDEAGDDTVELESM